ncbi:hypothetical protein [Cupriavidus agavae]|uniref:Uncharacterized protein n=1 Tax=Cupriavidus agavae TaxID=1001822 RepID=A0A4Q7S4V8_9BURK|nr:hypothetical protein [Cupriavidus agavae]RZT41454.1 hypothetical protein EV147_0445 [Cupriavidus agavae]
MRALEQFGWFVFNIAIPLLAPLALLSLVKLPAFLREQSRGVVRRAVEHGQMSWAALPMNASACYLLGGSLTNPAIAPQLVLAAITVHVSLLVLASIVIVLGALQSCSDQPLLSWGTNSIFHTSWVVTATTAAAHFTGYLYFT